MIVMMITLVIVAEAVSRQWRLRDERLREARANEARVGGLEADVYYY